MTSLEEKTLEAMMKLKEKLVQKNEQPIEKRPRITRTKKVVVPDHIKVLFDNLDKSINSVWGVQKDGKIKWDAKYNLWVVFKEYFMELSK